MNFSWWWLFRMISDLKRIYIKMITNLSNLKTIGINSSNSPIKTNLPHKQHNVNEPK
jgi:hypothetical protein